MCGLSIIIMLIFGVFHSCSISTSLLDVLHVDVMCIDVAAQQGCMHTYYKPCLISTHGYMSGEEQFEIMTSSKTFTL